MIGRSYSPPQREYQCVWVSIKWVVSARPQLRIAALYGRGGPHGGLHSSIELATFQGGSGGGGGEPLVFRGLALGYQIYR